MNLRSSNKLFLFFALLILIGCTQVQKGVTQPDDPQVGTSANQGSVSALETYTESIPGTNVQFSFVLIPGGTITLGSPESEPNRQEDEGPQRMIELEPFWMGIHEVTYDEYSVFRFREKDSDTTATPGSMYSADAATRPSPPYEDPSFGMGDEGYPAVGMTQYAALKYAKWLSEKTGKFYRLPTEAEWEYACRAGSETAYSFGDDPSMLPEYAWFYENSNDVYHQVGQKKPNAWGLYDMHGNVSEWTLDQYKADFYATLSENENPNPWVHPTRLHPRTVRGGAYDDDPEALRCADRLQSNLEWKRRDPQIPKSFWWNTDSPFLGFRLVRPARDMSPEEIREFWTITLDE